MAVFSVGKIRSLLLLVERWRIGRYDFRYLTTKGNQKGGINEMTTEV
jgi:hypothetical protein